MPGLPLQAGHLLTAQQTQRSPLAKVPGCSRQLRGIHSLLRTRGSNHGSNQQTRWSFLPTPAHRQEDAGTPRKQLISLLIVGEEKIISP